MSAAEVDKVTSVGVPFNRPVPAGGYSWWYVDALSDDGRCGITVIAFVGSVFSPYYAHARRLAPHGAEPLNHCALNVALYSRPGEKSYSGWAMTERGAAAVQRSTSSLRIGPSALVWNDDILRIEIDEVTVPWPARIQGVVRLRTAALLDRAYALDPAAHHHWCPIAPCARVEVELSRPALRWNGTGYVDANMGSRPLEQDFSRWDWSRAALRAGRSAVLYEITRRDGERVMLAKEFDSAGRARDFEAPPPAGLPDSRWRIARGTRADAGTQAEVAQTLEDGPFYARSVLNTHLLGEKAMALHESLSLQRFSAPWVQLLLPFRMPRRAG